MQKNFFRNFFNYISVVFGAKVEKWMYVSARGGSGYFGVNYYIKNANIRKSIR